METFLKCRISEKLAGKKICRLATVPFFLLSQLKSQAEYLKNIGMEVVLLSSDGSDVSLLTASGLEHAVINIPRSISVWRDFKALVSMYIFFRRQRFDIIHSTTPKAGLLSAVAGLLAGVPVRLHTFTGQQWTTLKGPLRYVSRLADKLIGKLNTHCYADSKSQRFFLIDEGIISFSKISVIGDGALGGVDVNRFDSNRWTDEQKVKLKKELLIPLSSKILIFIGRVTQEKGVSELLKAFQRLVENGVGVDLLIIGPLDQECGGNNTILLRDLNNIPHLHYLGYLSEPERYLAIADIFCLPSYREGFGTVVIEAAAMGVPAVGSKINGLVDSIEDGVTGILVESHNSDALYNAMDELCARSDLCESMGRAARERCHRLFSSYFVNKMVGMEYERLLACAEGQNV